MGESNEKTKGQHKHKRQKASKSSPSKSNTHASTSPKQADEAHPQSHGPTSLDQDSTIHCQEHPISLIPDHAPEKAPEQARDHVPDREVGDDVATAPWSHLATQGDDTTSQIQTQTEYTVIDETYTYELGRWAYETSNENLTLAERLEKSKW